MTVQSPTAELAQPFSSPDASAKEWPEAREILKNAETYWLSTVRPDGRPHVTPLIAVWFEEALHFCTGPDERKAKNLEANKHVVVTTGCNSLSGGLDVVVEGNARRITDDSALQRLADAYVAKYGEDWRFTVRDDAFHHDQGYALVFGIEPEKAFGFGKGEQFSQTRWRF
jgi:nitroimidazol reductase NimA-like FMN-containing flavoprotein (pyridoxamine 5'-phosphate oxidase superfamily)